MIMPRTLSIAAISLIAFGLATTACSEETDEAAQVEADAGTDTAAADDEADEEVPTVDSIDTDDAEPAETRRIRVETAEQAGIIPESDPLDAESYLEANNVDEWFDADDLDAISIAGQQSSPDHNSVRYRPAEADDQVFGIGLQIWDLTDRETDAGERLDELRDQFVATDDVDDDNLAGAFTSRRAGLSNLVFAGDSDGYVFVLTCDDETCDGIDELTDLGAGIAADH